MGVRRPLLTFPTSPPPACWAPKAQPTLRPCPPKRPHSLGRSPLSRVGGGSPGGSKQFPGAIPRREVLHSGQEVVRLCVTP